MISGTNVIEVLESLPNGDVIKVYGTGGNETKCGWRPRSNHLQIYQGANYMEITGKENIEAFIDILLKYRKEEKEYQNFRG